MRQTTRKKIIIQIRRLLYKLGYVGQDDYRKRAMMRKIIFLWSLVFVFIVFSYSASAVRLGETEFIEFNKECFAVTLDNVYSSYLVDVSLSRCVPNYAKSLNVGESQKYMSNWQCFVVTFNDVSMEGKSDVIVTKCAEPEEKGIEEEKSIVKEKEEKIIEEEKKEEIKEPEENVSVITSEQTIVPPLQQSPSSIEESFLEKRVPLGYVLFLVGLLIVLIFVAMVLYVQFKKI